MQPRAWDQLADGYPQNTTINEGDEDATDDQMLPTNRRSNASDESTDQMLPTVYGLCNTYAISTPNLTPKCYIVVAMQRKKKQNTK